MKCSQSAAVLVCACLSLASTRPGYAEPDYSEPALYTFTYGEDRSLDTVDSDMNMTRNMMIMS